MTRFIENIYDEIILTMTREDVKTPLNSIGNKNVKIETMLSTLNKHINKSDIAYIDYSLGGENNQTINPLNELFCDNIIVFSPIENRYLIGINNNNKQEIDIKYIPKELLGKTTANIKFAFNQIGLSINKYQIKPTRIKYIVNENYINQTTNYIQMLKVDLDQFESDKVIDILSNTENLNFLYDNNIFINDIDFTQDLSGLINKEQVIDYLINNCDFRMQGSNEIAKHTILDYDFKISRNCLTFIKHTNNGDIRYKFYNKFVQSLESPSVRDLVGSHLGDYICNPNDKLKKAIMLSKDSGILRLEITFYRHGTNEKLTKEFILDHMNYLKELLPSELIYHNPINNQFNLVCNNIVHNICIYNSKFNTALISLFQISLTGKSNGFFLRNVNTTNLSNALRYYTSNKPIIVLLTKIDFENNEISIQQDSNLRIGQELKTYISNGNTCKCITFKDNIPENIGIYPNDTFNFILPKKSISLSSTKNNNKFKKLDIDINSIKYPKTSSRNISKLKKEDYTIEKFKQEAEQKTINIKNEEIKMQQIRDEHKQLEINRDLLTNILKNQNSHTINLTKFENNTLIYVYALKQTNTRYGMNYTIIGSISDELNEEVKLFQFWSNSYINSQIKFDKFKKIDFGDILAYGSISGYPLLTLVKKYNFTSKSNHLSAFIQLYGINYDNREDDIENIQALNKLEILLTNINTRSCKEKIDELVNTNDILHSIGYRSLNKSLIVKLRINNELDNHYIIASYFLKEIVLNKIKDENQFSLITGPYKTNPQKKPSRIYLTP